MYPDKTGSMDKTERLTQTKKGKIELEVDVIEKIMRLQNYGETYSETLRRILMRFQIATSSQRRRKSEIDSHRRFQGVNSHAKGQGRLPMSEKEFQKRIRGLPQKCAMCGETDPLTVDHIIPLDKGGANTPDNLQILCRSCNNRKGTRVNLAGVGTHEKRERSKNRLPV